MYANIFTDISELNIYWLGMATVSKNCTVYKCTVKSFNNYDSERDTCFCSYYTCENIPNLSHRCRKQ